MHVLGADIPHHNLTLLTFFEQLAEQRQLCTPCYFMVVAPQQINNAHYPHLIIHQFSTQKKLAKRVICLAKKNQQRFFFHGQFNAWIWLALLSRQLRGSQLYWHIWGGDLYETAWTLRKQLLYLLRRLVQGKFREIFATEGDANEYLQRYPNMKVSRLYFPARQDLAPAAIRENTTNELKFTILLGNSGDPTNRHIEGLTQINCHFGQQLKLILPMGYPNNNESYIAQVEQVAQAIFPANQVEILRDKLEFADFQQVVAGCDLGYFCFERQQGIGTLCLLIKQNIPIVLTHKNRFWQDLMREQLPVLFDTDNLTSAVIKKAKWQLRKCDKNNISFMYPGYTARWIEILRRLNTEERK